MFDDALEASTEARNSQPDAAKRRLDSVRETAEKTLRDPRSSRLQKQAAAAVLMQLPARGKEQPNRLECEKRMDGNR